GAEGGGVGGGEGGGGGGGGGEAAPGPAFERRHQRPRRHAVAGHVDHVAGGARPGGHDVDEVSSDFVGRKRRPQHLERFAAVGDPRNQRGVRVPGQGDLGVD